MVKAPAEPTRFVVSRSRLEFLFDGIFAIAMTLLVLELKVPELADRHSVHELFQSLAHHGSTFFSYLLSFGMLGLLWYRHNKLYHYIHSITPGMLVLHLVQLAMAAFFPFCAALIGRYPINFLAVAIYTGCVLVYQTASTVGWYVAGRSKVLSPELSQAEFRAIQSRNLRGLLVISLMCLGNAVAALTS